MPIRGLVVCDAGMCVQRERERERELKYSVEYYNTSKHKILLVDVHAVFAVRLLKTMSVHALLATCTSTSSGMIVS